MATFDLVSEPWIPVLDHDGRLHHVGIEGVLLEAHAYREVFEASPLVTAALHRLLLAVAHRALQGPDRARWRRLWSAGRFDAAAIGEYLAAHRGGFDLLHPERPFFQQVDGWEDARVAPIAKLSPEFAAGNNATLFDHSRDDDPRPVSAAEAARRLTAFQAYAIGGGVSTPFNLSHGPLVAGYTVLAAGDSLFETLALNLMPYDRERPMPWGRDDDAPPWEGAAGPVPHKAGTPSQGWASWLAWQSRAVRLVPGDRPGEIAGCQIHQHLKPGESILDPFKAYRMSKDAGMLPLRFSAERALWRDSAMLFLQGSESSARPAAMDWLAEIDEWRDNGQIEARPVYRLRAYGMLTDKASVELWRTEELPLPLSLLDDPAQMALVGDAVRIAEEAGKAVGLAARRLAGLLLAPGSSQPGGREPDRAAVGQLARSIGIEARYWPRLELPFSAWLRRFAEEEAAAIDEWNGTVRAAAIDAFREGARGLAPSGRTLQAVAIAEREFRQRLRRALERETEESGEGGEAA